MNDHTTVKVSSLPTCDFCPNEAAYDGRIKYRGTWGYMCHLCFRTCGTGLGLGKGQKLILAK